MNKRLHRLRLRKTPFRQLVAGVTMLMFLAPITIANAAPSPGADLQSAYEDAAHEAKLSDDLDPAYELLGIAEAAHMRNFPQIAAKAATAFSDLVKRATDKALKVGNTPGSAGGSTIAEDTLDQFVDLRFVARSANLPLPQAALDDAIAALFPNVTEALKRKVDTAGTFADKLKYIDDLGDLQASATQILKQDAARDIGAAFDQKITHLEALVRDEGNTDKRAEMEDGLAKTRKAREEHLADAAINNINVVAELLRKENDKGFDGGTGAGGGRSEVEVPEELSAGVGSCIETGFTGQQDPALLRNMKLDCINSGRVPAAGRCPTTNLSFLCYDDASGSEKLTYVYRGTPDELYFEHKCSSDRVVKADKVPTSGAMFRKANAVLGFTCAPPSAE